MKQFIWVGMIVGSFAGSLIPLLWGAGALSFSSIVFSSIGALIGIYVAFKLTR